MSIPGADCLPDQYLTYHCMHASASQAIPLRSLAASICDDNKYYIRGAHSIYILSAYVIGVDLFLRGSFALWCIYTRRAGFTGSWPQSAIGLSHGLASLTPMSGLFTRWHQGYYCKCIIFTILRRKSEQFPRDC